MRKSIEECVFLWRPATQGNRVMIDFHASRILVRDVWFDGMRDLNHRLIMLFERSVSEKTFVDYRRNEEATPAPVEDVVRQHLLFVRTGGNSAVPPHGAEYVSHSKPSHLGDTRYVIYAKSEAITMAQTRQSKALIGMDQ